LATTGSADGGVVGESRVAASRVGASPVWEFPVASSAMKLVLTPGDARSRLPQRSPPMLHALGEDACAKQAPYFGVRTTVTPPPRAMRSSPLS